MAHPIQDPKAHLERAYMVEYLAIQKSNLTLETLFGRNDPAAIQLRADASQYASLKLATSDTRAHPVTETHGSFFNR